MRKRDWKSNLSKKLREFLDKDNKSWNNNYPDLTNFWEIELGLFVAQKLFPDERLAIESVWIVLSGYPFPVPELENLTPEQRKILANARHLLPEIRGQFRWIKDLESYMRVPESLRGYAVDRETGLFKRKPVTVLHERFAIYEKTVTETLPFQERDLKWAKEPGKYLIPKPENGDETTISLTIPEEFANYASNSVPSHDLTGKQHREPLSVPWKDLIATARWMDKQWKKTGKKSKNWEKRLKDIELKLKNDEFSCKADRLTIDGLFNLVGPVGTGKSTLMEVLAVWAVRDRPQRVTIIVPDVVDILKRAQLFALLGLKAAPILGSSNRVNHLNRLHRACAIAQPERKLTQDSEGFKWVSTGCALSDAIDEALRPNLYPCLSLRKTGEKQLYACPLYSVCPTHQASIDLVDADIWLATPASLVYTRVPIQINRENIRYGELIYRRSDLVIWDEVDRGMVVLDNIFSPYEELIDFLNQLRSKISATLEKERRSPLQNSAFNKWNTVHNRLQGATDQIVHFLQRQGSHSLQEWLSDIGDFFSDTLLFNDIAQKLSGGKESKAYKQLSDQIHNYLTQEGDSKESSILTNATNRLILEQDRELINRELRQWLQNNKTTNEAWSEQEWEDLLECLQFSLLIHALSQGLHNVLTYFTPVDSILKLGLEGSPLLNRPPLDFGAVVPPSPQGNTLGFQYRDGNLRFFKCRGVGRWIALHFHELFADEGICGPNVLIMSGTSWANASPGFHIQAPVDGILQPDPSTTQKIATESEFALRKFFYSNNQEVRVSGLRGQSRISALKELVQQLAKRGGLSAISQLEIERDNLPEGRQRVLLLTGSYREAELVANFLVKELRPDWVGKVKYLIRDDTQEDGGYSEFALARGNVEEFPRTDAWILIAPLLAIERGHNILNELGEAALGACYFLVRPHPVPDDLNLCLQMLNRWAIDKLADLEILRSWCGEEFNLVRLGQEFRKRSYSEWCRILYTEMRISTLKPDDKSALLWNTIVVLNQVVGRLFRGGTSARVYFCDAAFADMLPEIKAELQPYFEPSSSISEAEKAISAALYSTFYLPLKRGLYRA